MFEQQDVTYKNGIERYRALNYEWRSTLLRGSITALQESPDRLHAFASPDIDYLRRLDAAPQQRGKNSSLRTHFNDTRGVTIYLGRYDTLDAAAAYIRDLESVYERILTEKGAEDRILRAGRLEPAANTAAASFGEALRMARTEELHSVLRAGKPLPFEKMAGLIFRPFANALNIPYREEIERDAGNDNRLLNATYIFDNLAIFSFLSNGDDDFPTVIRSSWNENINDFRQTWSGPGTVENLRRHVMHWIADALTEKEQDRHEPAAPAARPLITSLTPSDRLLAKERDPRKAAQDIAANASFPPASPAAARTLLDRIVPPRTPFLRAVR